MRNWKRTIGGTACAGVALVAGGASAAAQEAPSPATYRLVEVAGGALPAVLEEADACREEVLGGTLTLEADGRWTLVTTEREVCGDAVEEEEEREDGTYEVDGDAIRFLDDDVDESDDPEDGADDAGEIELEDLSSGTRTDAGLTIRLEDGETVLVFRR